MTTVKQMNFLKLRCFFCVSIVVISILLILLAIKFKVQEVSVQDIATSIPVPNESNLIPKRDLQRKDNFCTESDIAHFVNGSIDFSNFNNVSGLPSRCYVVPNIVHLIKFNQPEFDFVEVICIASVLKNHRPDRIWIHTNTFQFKGKYWKFIEKLPGFDKIVVKYLSQPRSIFNFSFDHKYGNWHSSDVARLKLVQKYGGIYLDNDVYIIQSLNKYRVFEFALEWNYFMNLGNQVLIGNKDARVLSPWLETYRQYNGSRWYYNGGELPTSAVLHKRPELIHRVRDHFGTSTELINYLYKSSDKTKLWKTYDAIHLFIRHQSYIFNESSVLVYDDHPIKEMIMEVMPDYMYSTKSEL